MSARDRLPETAARTSRPFGATVIDAGVGNLANLARALRVAGTRPVGRSDSLAVGGPGTAPEIEVTDDPERVVAARCLVLPGVGAFAPPRERLRRSGLERALRAALENGAWLLGVCVGFQLLFEESEEFGRTEGLGLLAGRVARLPAGVPLPHIGWNALHHLASHPLLGRNGDRSPEVPGTLPPPPEVPGTPRGTLLHEVPGTPREVPGTPVPIPEGSHVYFVHSYAVEGAPDGEVLARATHGRDFPAIAGRGRVLGTQFHPEKSGPIGLALLAHYLEIAHGAPASD